MIGAGEMALKCAGLGRLRFLHPSVCYPSFAVIFAKTLWQSRLEKDGRGYMETYHNAVGKLVGKTPVRYNTADAEK